MPPSVNGADGKDSIIVDDSGETADSSAVVTAEKIGGLGMATVAFSDVSLVQILCGSGNDRVENLIGDAAQPRLVVDLGLGQS